MIIFDVIYPTPPAMNLNLIIIITKNPCIKARNTKLEKLSLYSKAEPLDIIYSRKFFLKLHGVPEFYRI